jgi:hypothetical protein
MNITREMLTVIAPKIAAVRSSVGCSISNEIDFDDAIVLVAKLYPLIVSECMAVVIAERVNLNSKHSDDEIYNRAIMDAVEAMRVLKDD